jgi:outer membrane protein assembly factor BamB
MQFSATRLLLTATALLLVAACSSSDKKDDKPMALDKKFVQQVEVKRVWHTSLGGELPKLRLGLGPAVDGNRIFLASGKGVVEAVDVNSGHEVWSRKLGTMIGGGPGVGGGIVAVGTSGGQAVALSESDGKVLWRVPLGGEILSAPAIGGNAVIVHTVDGKLFGLSAANGEQLWVSDQQVPRLSLRGTSPPLIEGDIVYTGFDNGRLVAVTLAGGNGVWDVAVGQAHGSSELQRLIDVDSPAVIDGDDIFSVSYQGRVVRLSRDSGSVVWTRDVSSSRGLAIDATSVYVSTSEGEVVKFDRTNGTEQWRTKTLLRRMLTGPLVYRGRIVVGDAEGYVHWISIADGKLLAREKVGKRISDTPVAAGDKVLVYTDAGELTAYSTPPG